MASKSNEDVLDLLDSLEKETKAAVSNNKKKEKNANAATETEKEDDIMGFLDSLTKNPTASGKNSPALSNMKNKKASNVVESTNEKENVEGVVSTEGSVEGNATKAGSVEPTSSTVSDSTADPIPDAISSITSWWSRNKGGLWDTASSAVKQAEARVKEFQPEVQQLQQSQQRALESLGGGISRLGLSKGLLQSTLTSVLETIAPPISRHEQLKINIFHDMVGYPALDSIVYGVFERVMQQVEGGGDLTMIVQKGKERHRRGSDAQQRRELGIFKGPLDQAIKLAAANIEDFVRKSQDKSKTTESKSAKETPSSDDRSESDSPVVRVSDVFLSIQPAVIGDESATAIAASGQSDNHIISSSSSSTFVFVIYLYDPNNDIKFSSVSQPFPYQWAEWLDSPDSTFQAFEADPREWVIDWVEEGLGLAVGIAAQSYVAKRMGTDSLFTVTKAVEEEKEKS
ncbi:Mtc1p [Sugiyamaella lignohabitans]|uniref:Mtc1p n=1 Tax=Sugiyamaella lignohabitans TaxID=796027 RepID=A0A167FRR7_9ASCO|nr:Mtc1p [Sugiyamaella lignohabitans]ANB15619.1 Mtc1p [Sugiyamaella lignohabitans]